MIRDVNNRTKLEDAIPLDTPLVVHIESTNLCNFKCKFCPTGDHELLKKYNVKKGIMEYQIFCKVIDDLCEFKRKVKNILFHIEGEPLLNKRLPDMIRYAKQKNVADRLILFTNGSLLNHTLSREIVNAGIDHIQISIEGVSDEKYKELVCVDINYEELVTKVEDLYKQKGDNCTIVAKIIDSGLTKEEKEKFYRDFTKISDSCHIENLISYIDESIKDTSLGLGKNLTTDNICIKEKDVCTNPFYVLSVGFDGRVSACSCDWRQSVIMGDSKNETLFEIWNGDKFNSFRRLQLEKKKNSHPACRECKSTQNQIDDIDDYAETILLRLKNEKKQ